MITFYANMILLCLPANVSVKIVAVDCCVKIVAWRLLLYFVDDLVAIGRGEAIDTMAYSADNGCRAVIAFPFQCTNAWLSFYMYISFFIPFELLYCFYYCLYLSEVTNKKLFNQFNAWTLSGKHCSLTRVCNFYFVVFSLQSRGGHTIVFSVSIWIVPNDSSNATSFIHDKTDPNTKKTNFIYWLPVSLALNTVCC